MTPVYVVEPVDGGVEVRFVNDGAVRLRIWASDRTAREMIRGFESAISTMRDRKEDTLHVAIFARLVALFGDVVSGGPGGSIPVPPDYGERLMPWLN